MNCHSCGKEITPSNVQTADKFVASDCQPVVHTLHYLECPDCGLVQKLISDDWHKLCGDIYTNYKIYHQGAGNEQKVISISGDEFAPRSKLITDFLVNYLQDEEQSTVLDIGCGNGSFLRIFDNEFKNWKVAGAELNTTFEADILALSDDARFIGIDRLNNLGESFKLVTLIHCLEHIASPIEYLKNCISLVANDGYLMVEVPDAERNPFDLLIADHASHFSKMSLKSVVEQASFEVVEIGNIVLEKEITLLARPAPNEPTPEITFSEPFLNLNYTWLQSMKALAEDATKKKPFGLFGSSIAASWLANEFKGEVSFFVDEDPNRIGQEHMGIKIISPDDIPTDATVFFGLEPGLARRLSARYEQEDFTTVVPPSV